MLYTDIVEIFQVLCLIFQMRFVESSGFQPLVFGNNKLNKTQFGNLCNTTFN